MVFLVENRALGAYFSSNVWKIFPRNIENWKNITTSIKFLPNFLFLLLVLYLISIIDKFSLTFFLVRAPNDDTIWCDPGDSIGCQKHQIWLIIKKTLKPLRHYCHKKKWMIKTSTKHKKCLKSFFFGCFFFNWSRTRIHWIFFILQK